MRRLIPFAALAPLAVLLFCILIPARADSVLEEGNGKQWYKGVTHFHTLWSDGDCAPETAVTWYQSHGYDFICISDHNILQTGENWIPIDDAKDKRLPREKVDALRKEFGDDWVVVEGRDGKPMMRLKTLSELCDRFQQPGKFLIVPGEEVTAQKAVHINAVNTRAVIPPQGGDTVTETLQHNLDAIEAHGHEHNVPILAHINHPNFSSTITAEEIVEVGGERVFEIYNGHGSVRNWGDPSKHIASTDRIWDIVLSLRLGRDGDTTKAPVRRGHGRRPQLVLRGAGPVHPRARLDHGVGRRPVGGLVDRGGETRILVLDIGRHT